MMNSGADEATVARWRRKVRRALPQADADLVEEIAQHVADRWSAARGRGLPQDAADAQARADLAQWQGRAIPERRPPAVRARAWIGLGADLHAAVRSLRVHPLFSVGAVLLSAVAAGAIVAGVTIVYGILWRPLPFPDADRLAVIWQVREGEETQISYPDFTDVASASVFDAASAVSGGRGSLRVGARIERVNAIDLEPSAFAMLGAKPHLGRLLTPADAGKPVCLIGHRLWVRHFSAAPDMVGRMLWLSGREYQVVGVLQPGFDIELPVPPSFVREDNDIWRLLDTSEPFAARRDFSGYEGLVRLAPGRSHEEAQAAADAVAARLSREHAATNAGRTFRVAALADEVVAPVRRPLLLVALGCIVTLLVAAANLGVLGLLRASERQQEFSVRQALGAGPWRVRRQLFAEHLLVAACGAGCGIALAMQLVHVLLTSEAADLPRIDAIRFDGPSWIAAAVVAFLAATVLTAGPVATTAASLRGGRTIGPAARRSRRAMVALEVALALTLCTGGALLALSVWRLAAVDPGFDPSGRAAARVSAYAARYPTREDVVRVFEEILARLRADPQVRAAGAGSSLPLSGQASGTIVAAQGQVVPLAQRPSAGWQFVSPGYLEAAGLRLRAGRDFTAADLRRDAHVTIVSESLARALFGAENPLGLQIAVGGGDGDGDWHEIVGIVADVRHLALDTEPAPRVYDLFGQHWGRTLYVVSRSAGSDPTYLPALTRRTVATVDPEAPVFELSTVQALVDRSAAGWRLASAIAVALAAAGVVLALIGVYAVMTASVSERTKEMGVRAALGASPRDLWRLVGGEGVRTIAWGAAAGLLASAALARLMTSQLFGSRAWDLAWVLPLVLVALCTAAALAALPPMRRAASIDPLLAIRAE